MYQGIQSVTEQICHHLPLHQSHPPPLQDQQIRATHQRSQCHPSILHFPKANVAHIPASPPRGNYQEDT